MISEDAPGAGTDRRADIHVWMSTGEAAALVGLAADCIEERIAQGELDFRVADDGSRQVLVCLPWREGAWRSAAASLPPKPPARPASSIFWRSAAASLLLAGAAALLLAARALAVNDRSAAPSEQLRQLSRQSDSLASERERLSREVVQLRKDLAQAQGELAVERKVEDTLIKAALAAHAPLRPSGPALADGGQ